MRSQQSYLFSAYNVKKFTDYPGNHKNFITKMKGKEIFFLGENPTNISYIKIKILRNEIYDKISKNHIRANVQAEYLFVNLKGQCHENFFYTETKGC